MRAKTLLLSVVIGAMFFSPAAMAKGKKKGSGLDMGAGTVQLGGQATVEILSADGNSETIINLSPEGGVFISDQIEILAGVSLLSVSGESLVGFQGGARGFFTDLSGMPVYVGAGIEYGEVNISFVSEDVLAVALEGGLLIPTSRNVAIDLGAKVLIYPDLDVVRVPIGYFGIQGFFDAPWK